MSPPRAIRSLKIAVLCGGASSERAISLRSGENVAKALREAGHIVTILDPAKQLQNLVLKAKRFDVAFLALHGAGGEDGKIQGLLESTGLPYTGSGVLASALAMDKVMAKAMYASHGIQTPPGAEVGRVTWKMGSRAVVTELIRSFGRSLVVKPASAGSSVGVTLTSDAVCLRKAITKAIKADLEGRCLVEKRIRGRELTVGVLGNAKVTALPIVEICPKTTFFDIKAKYDASLCDEICPAVIPDKITKEVQDIGIKAHKALRCRGYSRTDVIWDDTHDELYVLETNTLPGMTKTSLLPQAAAAAGIDFTTLLERMIALAIETP